MGKCNQISVLSMSRRTACCRRSRIRHHQTRVSVRKQAATIDHSFLNHIHSCANDTRASKSRYHQGVRVEPTEPIGPKRGADDREAQPVHPWVSPVPTSEEVALSPRKPCPAAEEAVR